MSDPPSNEPVRVFISYSRKDLAFVDRLDAVLRERGIEPLIDRTDIYAFEDWWQRIQGLIAEADTILFVLSPEAVTSPICLKEVEFAASLNKRFAPIVARAVAPDTVPASLNRLNFIFLDQEAAFEGGIDRLVAALSTDIDWVRKHSDYGRQALAWAQARPGKAKDLLLRSPALEAAEQWIAGRPAQAPVPTEDTQAFIARSRQAATRRRNLLSMALAAGLVLALGLAALAYWQRQVALDAQIAEIAQRERAEAQTQLALRREEEASRERDRATRAEGEALTQRDAARRNFEVARTTVDRVVQDLAEGLRRVDGIKLSVLRNVLTRVQDAVDRLGEAAPGDAGVEASRIATLIAFGDTYLVAGDGAEATRSFEAALRIAKAMVEAEPSSRERRNTLAWVLNKIGDVKWPAGDFKGGRAAYEEGLSITRALAGEAPDDAKIQYSLAFELIKLSPYRGWSGDAAGAEQAAEEGLELARRSATKLPDDLDWQRLLAVALTTIGDIKRGKADRAGALSALEEALGLARELARRDADNTERQLDIAQLLVRIGDVQAEGGAQAEAIRSYQDGIAIMRTLVRRDVENTAWQQRLGASLGRVGELRRASGDAAGAVSAYEESVAIYRALVRRDPQNSLWQRVLADALQTTGELKVATKEAASAVALLDEAVTLRKEAVRAEPDNPALRYALAQGFDRLGQAKEAAGDDDGSALAYEESLGVLRPLVRGDGALSDWRIELVKSLINVARLSGDKDKMRPLLEEALAVMIDLDRTGAVPEGMKGLIEQLRNVLEALKAAR